MKKFLKENAFKLTIGGNLFALSGLLYVLLLLSYIVLIYIKGAGSGTGMALVIILFFLTQAYFVGCAISLLVFLLELLFRHRLKNNFFKENKIYNVFFYLSLATSIFVMLSIFGFLYYLDIENAKFWGNV